MRERALLPESFPRAPSRDEFHHFGETHSLSLCAQLISFAQNNLGHAAGNWKASACLRSGNRFTVTLYSTMDFNS